MTLRLGGDGAITGCTSLENPDLTVSGLTISGSFDAEKVLVASGTAAAPSYTFSGDTDNGLYYAGTNSIGLATAGANAILIDSSARVGIGTTSPDSLLDLEFANSRMRFEQESGSNRPVIRGTRTSDKANRAISIGGSDISFLIGSTSTAALTSADEKVRIDSSGNVGIGTTSPAGALHVDAASGVDGPVLDSGGTANTNHALLVRDSANNQLLRVNNNGKVGIGATSPSDLLHVRVNASGDQSVLRLSNANATQGNTVGINFAPANDIVSVAIKAIAEDSHNAVAERDGALGFFTRLNGGSVTEKMRINSSGNVRIGTTDAGTAKLRFDNALDTTSSDVNKIHLFNNGSTIAGFGISSGQLNYKAPAHVFYLDDNSTALFINSTGKVGIGTATPGKKFVVYGTANTEEVIEVNNTTGSADGDTTNATRFVAGNGNYWANARYNAYAHVWGFGGNASISEAARIDSSGRLLVGTSVARTTGAGGHAELQVKSPNSITTDQVVIAAKFQANTSTSSSECLIACSAGYNISANDTEGHALFGAAREGTGNQAGFIVKTGTNNAERMRISSSGHLAFGSSSTTRTQANRSIIFTVGTNGDISINHSTSNNSGDPFLTFGYNGTAIGSVTQSGNSAVLYNTTSDYRLKENVVDLDGAITRVKQLAPKRFNFIADDSRVVDGFLAHEAQTVVPEAVTGTHNEVDDDGNPVMQGIDQSKLVPLLTAALKEAITKIETLEAEVAALKAQ